MVRFGNDRDDEAELDELEVDELEEFGAADLRARQAAVAGQHRSSPVLGSAAVTPSACGRKRLQSIAVGVEHATYVELVELAVARGCPMSALVREAIDAWLARER